MIFSKISGFSDEISKDIKNQFQVLNQLGLSFFEVRGVNGKNISELCDEEVEALKEEMKRCGIRASSIGSPIGKINLTGDLEEHFQLFKRVVIIAKQLESRYIRIFSFYHDGDCWTEEERSLVIEQLSRMITYAKEQDVILLHENEKDVYGDTIERCLDLMQDLFCDHFKAVFDPANFVQCGEDTLKAYQTLKQYIAYVHIKDACKEDNRVVPAGYGDGNIKEILADLKKEKYEGFLSLEPHLGSFEGLEKLEVGDAMLQLEKSSPDLFSLALDSLKNILNNL